MLWLTLGKESRSVGKKVTTISGIAGLGTLLAGVGA
jgi:hypothetical protein